MSRARPALALCLALASAPAAAGAAIDWPAAAEETARLLAEYIRIDTTNPPGNELAGARHLARFLGDAGLEPAIHESAPGRGNVVVRLRAADPDPRRGPILLLSHIDVVPADASAWTVPPLAGEIRDGFVWGRGALDDKGHGAVFAMALALLRREGVTLRRDLVFCATAAEEAGTGGADWMVANHWDALGPPAVVWNEGGGALAHPLAPDRVVNGIATTEKRALWLTLATEGESGHGSQPLRDGAVARLARALDRLDRWETPLRLTTTVAEGFRRAGEPLGFPRDLALRHLGNPVVLALASPRLTANRVTNAMVRDTVSLTGLRAGLKHNVIPGRAEATIDVRLLPDTDAAAFLEDLERAIGDSRVRIEGIPDPLPPVLEQSPVANELFAAIEAEMAREIPGSITVPTQTTGGTDSSWFRARGVPAYGFIPAQLPEELVASIHGVDERAPIAELERALRVTYRVLLRLAAD
jgi:acetylornithine deacetylase/succinyl-diaminopimelate desuccinylase-like protein